jgi:hypothetical protein
MTSLLSPPTVYEAVNGYFELDFTGPATVRIGPYPAMAPPTMSSPSGGWMGTTCGRRG